MGPQSPQEDSPLNSEITETDIKCGSEIDPQPSESRNKMYGTETVVEHARKIEPQPQEGFAE